MFEIAITREFCAAHSLIIRGQREPVHGHNWRATIVVAGEALDDDGLLMDFHALERKLDAITSSMDNADLNSVTPFDQLNPTAERVAQHIGQAVMEQLPPRVQLISASVTEAPGCVATFRPT